VQLARMAREWVLTNLACIGMVHSPHVRTSVEIPIL